MSLHINISPLLQQGLDLFELPNILCSHILACIKLLCMDMGIKSILCIIMPLNLVEGLLDIYPEVVALFFNGGRVANFTDYNMYAVWMLDSANE